MDTVAHDLKNARGFLTEALNAIPSEIGRLVLLSGLYNPRTRRYLDPLASLVFGHAGMHRHLADAHHHAFTLWLSLTLEAQVLDLIDFFSDTTRFPGETADKWLRDRSYEKLIPPGTIKPQADLFLGDLRIALDLATKRS